MCVWGYQIILLNFSLINDSAEVRLMLFFCLFLTTKYFFFNNSFSLYLCFSFANGTVKSQFFIYQLFSQNFNIVKTAIM